MTYLNLPSFSLLKKNVEIINASKRINDLLIQKSLFICSGKIWRSIGILFLLIYNSDLSFAQTMGGLPTEVISNCVISPTTPVCPNAVTTYSAPTGMTSYAWSITGAGYITGPVNGRTIKVTSGSNCNTSYKLTITYTNALITSTCIQAIPIVDNKLPTIVAAASKSVPSNTTNVVFDNPTMNDACGTPVLIVLSTTSVTNPSGSVSYTRTWKAIDVCDNSSATCSQTVTVNSALPCSITGNSIICQNGSTELCATAGATSYLWNTGATTQCINITSAGTYSVIIVEAGVASNCSKIVTIGSQSNCLISGNGSICTNGASNLCAPAGAASYLWSNGGTSQCISATTAGTYSVIITNSSGCTSTCSKIINQNNPPNCTITGNLFLCSGGSTQLCAPAGLASYSWSTGATTQCITVNAVGNYTVIVTGSNGCTSSCSQTVDGQAPPVCSISGNSTICPDGTTNLCAPSGAASYAWNTGATSQCITVSNAGTYTVTITNASGCSSTCSKTITMSNPPQCLISGDNSFCPGGSVNLCGVPGAASYLWSTGATSLCISVSTPGTYSLTMTDSKGCSSICNKVIRVNSQLPCSISGISSFCPGGSTNLCGPSGASSYFWNTGETTQCISVDNPGNYSVEMTDANGCSSSCNKDVTISNTQTCTITGNNSTCAGGSINLCTTVGASSYLWNTGATTQCISVSNSDLYSVRVIDENGCSSLCTKSIDLNVAPQCSITGKSSFCQGGSTNLCAPSGATSYKWSTGATTQCLSVNVAGNYSVTLTNASGCSSTCNKNVTVDSPPNCTIGGTLLICTGGSSELCATQGVEKYLWNTGSANQCISVNNSGNYSVTLTGSNNCISTCSQNIDFLSPPVCNITGNTSICSGGTTSLCATPGASSYVWSTGATTQCINVSAAGLYSVIATGENGCTTTCSKSVTVNIPLTCSITGNSSICSGGATSLCVTAGAGTYEWSTQATTPCITVNTAGTYSAIITDINGCISTCSQTVTVNQIPACTITGINDICQGNNTVFTASGGNSYLWNTGATTPSITVSSAGSYSVKVTNANTCNSACSRTLAVKNCGISLKKTSDVCEFPNGVPTSVNFKYVIKNTGSFFNASGNLVDDNGTANNTADDINVCAWGPIVPGDSVTCTRAFTISSTHTNIAKAIGTSGGTSVNATASATVAGINCTCNISYPDNSNLPRSSVIFNESEILRASDPGPTSCGSTGSVIKLWYNDEHALLLGVRSVSVKTISGTTITNYNITPTPTSAACVTNPLVGDTISTGDQAGNDIAAGGGRPLWPAIFITDLTVNGSNSRIGDWQQGGKGTPPTSVCGTWKSAVKTIDKTRNPPIVTITTDANPAKNNWNLGSGSHTPAGGFASLRNEGYGAEVSWDVNKLGLIPGHTYRLVFMVHDGDQNKTGGDVGHACTTIHIPDLDCTPVPPPPPPSDKICYTGTSNRYVKASQQWTINTTVNQVTIRTTFSKNFVDNTYGLNAIGWPSGNTFNQLVGSDNLQMALFDANNVKKMEFKVDYVTASNSVSSGYKCLGVTGGEGYMLLGNISDVVSATSSIDKNLNTFGYVLTTNSPASNSSYTPNASYPNWIYDVWYEVTVKLSAFGTTGFGKPGITSIQASPSKTGSNTENIVDTVCTQSFSRMAAPDSPSRINAIAYPNPFGNDFTINFITPLEEDAILTITDLAGRIVESSKHAAGKINMGLNLKAGIYFVRISQGEFYKSIKIIKSTGME